MYMYSLRGTNVYIQPQGTDVYKQTQGDQCVYTALGRLMCISSLVGGNVYVHTQGSQCVHTDLWGPMYIYSLRGTHVYMEPCGGPMYVYNLMGTNVYLLPQGDPCIYGALWCQNFKFNTLIEDQFHMMRSQNVYIVLQGRPMYIQNFRGAKVYIKPQGANVYIQPQWDQCIYTALEGPMHIQKTLRGPMYIWCLVGGILNHRGLSCCKMVGGCIRIVQCVQNKPAAG